MCVDFHLRLILFSLSFASVFNETIEAVDYGAAGWSLLIGN